MLSRTSNSQINIDWLKHIVNTQNHPNDEILTLASHWVIEPRLVPLSSTALRDLAIELKPQTKILLLCDVKDEEYNQSISASMSNWPLTVIGFKGISQYVMADAITKLDFSKIKKIGLCNLDNLTLWLLFSKLVCWEMEGNQNISIHCGTEISENWKNCFRQLKNKEVLQKIHQEVSPIAFGELTKALNAITKLQTTLSVAQKNLTMLQQQSGITVGTVDLTDPHFLSAERIKSTQKHILLVKEITALKNELDQANAQISLEISKCRDLHLELSMSKALNDNLSRQVVTLRKDNDTLKAKIIKLETDVECSKLFASDEAQQIHHEKQQVIENYERQLTQSHHKNTEISTLLTGKMTEIAKLTYDNGELIKKITLLTTQEKELRKQLATQKESISTLTLHRDALIADNGILSLKLATTQEELAKSTELEQTFMAQIDELEVCNVKLQTHVDCLTATVTTHSVKNLLEEKSHLERKKERYKSDLLRARKMSEDLKINPATLGDSDSADEEKAHTHKHKRAKHHKTSRTSLQKEMAELRSQLRVAQSEIAVLQEQKTELEKLNASNQVYYHKVSKEKTDGKNEAEKKLREATRKIEYLKNSKETADKAHAHELATLTEEKNILVTQLAYAQRKINEEFDMESMFSGKNEHRIPIQPAKVLSPLLTHSFLKSTSPALSHQPSSTAPYYSVPAFSLTGSHHS